MNKLQWLLTICFITIFLVFFAKYRPADYEYDGIDLSVTTNMSTISKDTKYPFQIKIIYTAKNNYENVSFKNDEYFYRIVLGRSYDSSGFILKDFGRDLNAKEYFKGTYDWNIPTFLLSGGRFRVYFNMYKDVAFSDPILVSSSEVDVTFQQ